MAPEDNRQTFEPLPDQEPSAEAVSTAPQTAELEPAELSVESLPDAGPAEGSFKARIQSIGAQLKDLPLEENIRTFGAWLKRTPLFRTQRRTIVTLVVGIPLFLCLASWLFGLIAFSDAASLVGLKGMVHTRREDKTQWEPASLNQLLWREDWVRTGAESSASLRFFDVSTVDLEEETEVSIAQISKRRGGNSVDVVLKVWLGRTAVRAVRFVDPSSSFRVDTPTASTVVRGARFNVQVDEDGTTQIDLEAGEAKVEVNGETVVLAMGERITLDPDGLYEVEQVFEPDPQLVIDKVEAAWDAPGDEFRLELTENEVNQFLAAASQQPDFFLRHTQIWFVEDELRLATTVIEPARFDLSAAIGVRVVDGEIKPQVRAVAAGINLPVPGVVLNPALDQLLSQQTEYLAQAQRFIEFSDVQLKDGNIIITGHK